MTETRKKTIMINSRYWHLRSTRHCPKCLARMIPFCCLHQPHEFSHESLDTFRAEITCPRLHTGSNSKGQALKPTRVTVMAPPCLFQLVEPKNVIAPMFEGKKTRGMERQGHPVQVNVLQSQCKLLLMTLLKKMEWFLTVIYLVLYKYQFSGSWGWIFVVKHNLWFLLITGFMKILMQHERRKNAT